MDYKAMTYEELVAIKDSIQLELLRRESEERQQAINDFKEAFEKLQKHVWLIEVDTHDGYYPIGSFDDFNFEG